MNTINDSKKPKKDEGFEAWLLRCFYCFHDGIWYDTSTYPFTSYDLDQLKKIYDENKKP